MGSSIYELRSIYCQCEKVRDPRSVRPQDGGLGFVEGWSWISGDGRADHVVCEMPWLGSPGSCRIQGQLPHRERGGGSGRPDSDMWCEGETSRQVLPARFLPLPAYLNKLFFLFKLRPALLAASAARQARPASAAGTRSSISVSFAGGSAKTQARSPASARGVPDVNRWAREGAEPARAVASADAGRQARGRRAGAAGQPAPRSTTAARPRRRRGYLARAGRVSSFWSRQSRAWREPCSRP